MFEQFTDITCIIEQFKYSTFYLPNKLTLNKNNCTMYYFYILVWINYGLAQISRAYGQRAMSPHRARPGFALLARV